MARLTFGATKQAAGAAILINGAARRPALGTLIEANLKATRARAAPHGVACTEWSALLRRRRGVVRERRLT